MPLKKVSAVSFRKLSRCRGVSSYSLRIMDPYSVLISTMAYFFDWEKPVDDRKNRTNKQRMYLKFFI
jgi:hypothetical protein